MSDEIENLYRAHASGTAEAPLDRKYWKAFQALALHDAHSEDEATRKKALIASSALPEKRSRMVLEILVRDPILAFRRGVYERALVAPEDGLVWLRTLAQDPDEQLALDAISKLTLAVDNRSLVPMRQLLSSTSAPLRAAAVGLLGNIAGKGQISTVKTLLDDPDPEVKEAAALAMDRITGEAPKLTWSQWCLAENAPEPASVTKGQTPAGDTPEEVLYRQIIAGTAPDPIPTRHNRYLMWLARQKAGAEDENARVDAMRVIAAIGGPRSLQGAMDFVRDPSPAIRATVFDLAKGQNEAGIYLIRMFAEDSAPDLARSAMVLLDLVVDRNSIHTARRLLEHTDAEIRRLAVELIGNSAGRSFRPQLEPLLNDPVPEVKAAATVALSRIDGEEPRRTGGDWWSGGPVAVPRPTPVPTPPPAPVPPLPPTSPESALHLAPPPVTEAPDSDAPEPEMEADTDLEVLVAPPPAIEDDADEDSISPEDDTAADGNMPLTLPTEPAALARLLGLVSFQHRGAIVDQLGDGAGLAELFADYEPNYTDPEMARGLALSAGLLLKGAWTSRLRPMFNDPNARVRAAAAWSTGELGGPSSMSRLVPLLRDLDSEVRAAAVAAIATLAKRMGRPDLARGWLRQVEADPSPKVRAAVQEHKP